MAGKPSQRNVGVGRLGEPPTEAQLNLLVQLNEEMDLPARYYPTISRNLSTYLGVQRAIRLFERFGTPKR